MESITIKNFLHFSKNLISTSSIFDDVHTLRNKYVKCVSEVSQETGISENDVIKQLDDSEESVKRFNTELISLLDKIFDSIVEHNFYNVVSLTNSIDLFIEYSRIRRTPNVIYFTKYLITREWNLMNSRLENNTIEKYIEFLHEFRDVFISQNQKIFGLGEKFVGGGTSSDIDFMLSEIDEEESFILSDMIAMVEEIPYSTIIIDYRFTDLFDCEMWAMYLSKSFEDKRFVINGYIPDYIKITNLMRFYGFKDISTITDEDTGTFVQIYVNFTEEEIDFDSEERDDALIPIVAYDLRPLKTKEVRTHKFNYKGDLHGGLWISLDFYRVYGGNLPVGIYPIESDFMENEIQCVNGYYDIVLSAYLDIANTHTTIEIYFNALVYISQRNISKRAPGRGFMLPSKESSELKIIEYTTHNILNYTSEGDNILLYYPTKRVCGHLSPIRIARYASSNSEKYEVYISLLKTNLEQFFDYK